MRDIEWLKEIPSRDNIEDYDDSLDDIIKYKDIIGEEVMGLIYELNESVADFDWILYDRSLRAENVARTTSTILIRYIDTIRDRIAVYNKEIQDTIERKLTHMEDCIKVIKCCAGDAL